MALITDPDFLNQNAEISIDTINKTIGLTEVGNLDTGGVTGQAFYSFLKEEWKTDASLIPYPFPMVSITPEQFEFIAGWIPADDLTRSLLRSCGWREIDAGKVVTREYMGIISLGNIDSTDTAYYAFEGDTAKTDFDFAGPVNQGIQTFGDLANGSVDQRTNALTTYIRTQGKLYGSATTNSIGLTGLNYIANRFPLAEAVDTKISTSDNDIETLAPYIGMSITYSTITRDIGGNDRTFKVLIDGNFGTAEQINEFVQHQLRQGFDIDANLGGTVGSLADSLTAFLGNTLKTKEGVFIDNFLADDTNRIIFTDESGVERTFPFVATGTLSFNTNLQEDAGAIYRVFFSDTFGTANATIVNDNSGNPLSGLVSGNPTIGFDFDYDGNVQQGRVPALDADVDVTVVSIGLDSAQYVSATSTIGRASGQNISLVAPLERNYANPA
tara:strand:- start:297 stop:1622 length:1326 start_codon:yes stop_codon:yes gene_type:complete